MLRSLSLFPFLLISRLERCTLPSLPGLDTPEKLDALEKEAFDLSCNPRGSESNGGALALRLVCKLRYGGDEAGQGLYLVSIITSAIMAWKERH